MADWRDRLERFAGWDALLEIVVIAVLMIAGIIAYLLR